MAWPGPPQQLVVQLGRLATLLDRHPPWRMRQRQRQYAQWISAPGSSTVARQLDPTTRGTDKAWRYALNMECVHPLCENGSSVFPRFFPSAIAPAPAWPLFLASPRRFSGSSAIAASCLAGVRQAESTGSQKVSPPNSQPNSQGVRSFLPRRSPWRPAVQGISPSDAEIVITLRGWPATAPTSLSASPPFGGVVRCLDALAPMGEAGHPHSGSRPWAAFGRAAWCGSPTTGDRSQR